MRIKILGHNWEIKVLSDDIFEKEHGVCLGITLPYEKEIFIKRSCLDYYTLSHEITHGFQFYTCLYNVNLNNDKMEEYISDFMSIHGEDICKLTRKYLKLLK